MCAYTSVFGHPCCDNDQLLTRILREEWGYKGLVVSDCSAIRDLYAPPGHQPYPGDPTTAISHAVRSGTDLECGKTYRQMADAIREGKIDEKDVDVSLRRLLVARFRLGEFDPAEQDLNALSLIAAAYAQATCSDRSPEELQSAVKESLLDLTDAYGGVKLALGHYQALEQNTKNEANA